MRVVVPLAIEITVSYSAQSEASQVRAELATWNGKQRLFAGIGSQSWIGVKIGLCIVTAMAMIAEGSDIHRNETLLLARKDFHVLSVDKKNLTASLKMYRPEENSQRPDLGPTWTCGCMY